MHAAACLHAGNLADPTPLVHGAPLGHSKPYAGRAGIYIEQSTHHVPVHDACLHPVTQAIAANAKLFTYSFNILFFSNSVLISPIII